MTGIFKVQGFGVLSEYNGELATSGTATAIQAIADTGANSLEIAPRIWVQNQTSSTLTATSLTDSDASIIASIEAAEQDGLSVIIKPALASIDGTASNALEPGNAASFFASYQAEIVHLATIAQETGVQTLAIGNELGSLSGSQYLPYWTQLISAVRSVYSGQLTYSAASDEANHVSFWSQLDVIGINAYPPLTTSAAPPEQELVNAWTQVPVNSYYAAAYDQMSPLDFFHSLSETYAKPLLLTEVGYRSIDGTAINPGDWQTAGTVSDQAQTDAYQAFFQVWTQQSSNWFEGVEFWQWDLNNTVSPTGYSPMGKPAQQLVQSWFEGHGVAPALTTSNIQGSAGTTTVTVTGYGVTADGVNPQMELWVNGKEAGSAVSFTPAADPWGYQTYTFTFTDPAQVKSLDFAFMNASAGRGIYIKQIDVDGTELNNSQLVNNSSPGTLDLYVNTIHFDATTDQALFSGAANTGVMDSNPANQAAVYSGKEADYTISHTGNEYVVTDSVTGRDGVTTLTNISTLQFSDGQVSLSYDATTQVTSMLDILSDGVVIKSDRDAQGNLISETVVNTDGTSDVYQNDIANKPYISQETSYNAAGIIVSVAEYAASGALYANIAHNNDGSVVETQFDANGNFIQIADTLANGVIDTKNYSSAAVELTETIQNTDGSHEFFQYDIANKPYTSDEFSYNTTGHAASLKEFTSNGELYASTTYNSDGSSLRSQYDASGHLTQTTNVLANSETDTITFDTSGNKLTETEKHPDGSSDNYNFDPSDTNYSYNDTIINNKGTITAIDEYNAGGSLYSTRVVTANGSVTINDYVKNGGLAADAANDTFVFKGGNGQTTIYGFTAGNSAAHDTIDNNPSLVPDFSHLNIQASGHDTLITFGHDTLILKGVDIHTLTQGDFLFA